MRRRFLAVAIPGLAVLLATTGYSYLGNTATSDPTITSGTASSNFVYPVAASGNLPCEVASLKYTTSGDITVPGSCTAGTNTTFTSTVVNPSWTPVAQSAGSVNGGDISVIDASTTNMGNSTGLNVSLYVTNLANLQLDYSSLALPVSVYQATCASGCTWSAATNVSTSYLTSTSGYLTWNLPAGYYYDIAIDTGGSLYCTATTAADLSPTYYVSAQSY